MIINCPKCGRELRVESTLFGHLIGCPLCQARFSMPDPFRKIESSKKSRDDVDDDYWKDDSDYYYYDDDE